MKTSIMNPVFYEKTKEGETLYDVYGRLIKDRVIFLCRDIDSDTASIVCALLFLLDRQNDQEPISIWISSNGGDVYGFLAIYDMMQLVKAPIETICIGSACSAAAMILAAGSKGLRYATPNSEVMIHQIQAEPAGGTGTEVEIEAKEIKKLNAKVRDIVARHTGQYSSKVKRDLIHDRYLTAQEALEYGIVDSILGPTKEIPELKVRKKPESDG